MEKPDDKPSPAYPWYDDRVAELRADGPAGSPLTVPEDDPQTDSYRTPQKIYDYLAQHVWK